MTGRLKNHKTVKTRRTTGSDARSPTDSTLRLLLRAVSEVEPCPELEPHRLTSFRTDQKPTTETRSIQSSTQAQTLRTW